MVLNIIKKAIHIGGYNMKTITLTDEEYHFIKSLFERIIKQQERKPRKRKWVKHDGLMINLQTGEALDVRSNKFVIDLDPELLAHLIEVHENESNLRALSGSDANNTDLTLPDSQSAPDWSAHDD